MSLWNDSGNVGAQSIVPPSQEDTTSSTPTPAHHPRWQTLLFWLAIVALFAIAIGMRLYNLGLPFDRDTYDEGVYWQSLRAMSAGHPLYSQIFYSQPPFFLLSTFPTYILFGGTLWSARFGIALVSLFGLVGASLLGKALSGRIGALAALLLLVVNPQYLQQSQTIQAEASCVAFSLLAVGLAYLWWEHPEGTRGIVLAGLTGVAVSLSILCKLFGVAALVPLVLLILTRLWLIWRQPSPIYRRPSISVGTEAKLRGIQNQPSEAERLSIPPSRSSISVGADLSSPPPIYRPSAGVGLLSILVGIGTCLLTILLVMLPFTGSLNALLQSVIFFHTTAGTVAASSQQGNISIIEHALYSVLTLAALYGTLAALLRRDWRVLPLLAWLIVTIFLLWRQVPLFGHHLVILTAPLIALAVMGIGSMPATMKAFLPGRKSRLTGEYKTSPLQPDRTGLPLHLLAKYTTDRHKALSLLAILLILVTAVLNVRQDRQYYRMEQANSQYGIAEQEAGPLALRAAADLRQAIAPDQLVVTDAQFVAALADRNTPPSLVDTSAVRIGTGQLTLAHLIDTTSEAQVHAVLFFTGRLQYSIQVAGFHTWVAHHFRLLYNYGGGKELWVR